MAEQQSKMIEPTHVEEAWTIIHLPNGDKIKSKHVVLGVHMLVDEKDNPKKLEDGSIIYGVTFSLPVMGVMQKDDKIKQQVN